MCQSQVKQSQRRHAVGMCSDGRWDFPFFLSAEQGLVKKPDKVALIDAFLSNVICSPDLFLSRFWRPAWSSMCQCQVNRSPRPLE